MGKLKPGILITRTAPQAAQSAQTLEKCGFHTFVQPMLHITPTKNAPPPLHNIKYAIATSVHGVAALARCKGADALSIFCFPGASLDAAIAAKFDHIHSMPGNAAMLAHFARCFFEAPLDKGLWVRGRHAAFDVAADMRKEGYDVKSWCAYEAHKETMFDEGILAALHQDNIHCVLFYSARGAQAFCALAQKENVDLRTIAALAISPAVADVLADAGFAAIYQADTPVENSMIDTLKAMFAL